jgi:hypothetical protein
MNLHQRRTFITLLGGAAALPLAVQAQQPAIPVIGFLSSSSAPITTKRISSFGQGLSEIGYTVGRDATVEARMAEGQYDRMPALATDLVSRRRRGLLQRSRQRRIPPQSASSQRLTASKLASFSSFARCTPRDKAVATRAIKGTASDRRPPQISVACSNQTSMTAMILWLRSTMMI